MAKARRNTPVTGGPSGRKKDLTPFEEVIGMRIPTEPPPDGLQVHENVVFSPKFAGVLLDRCCIPGGNRKSSPTRIEFYAKQMLARDFDDETNKSSPMMVTRDHVLINGEQRLRAVVKSGITVRGMLMTGVNPRVGLNIDDLRPRRLNDFFELEGYNSRQSLVFARTTRLIVRYCRGVLPGRAYQMTNAEGHRFFHKNVGIYNSCMFSLGLGRGLKRMSPAQAAAAHYLFSKVNEGEANEFFEAVRDKDWRNDGWPPHTLVRQLEADIQRRKGEKLYQNSSVPVKFGLAIMAWNAWDAGKKPRTLKLPAKGWPAIVGFDLKKSGIKLDG